jgi:hypothetical protein
VHSCPKIVAGNRIDVWSFGQRGSSHNKDKKRRQKKLEYCRSPACEPVTEYSPGSQPTAAGIIYVHAAEAM